MTEDERHAVLDECFEHNDHLRANGHLVAEVPLQPPETALTLHWKNDKVATTDGPYAETKEQLGGLQILEARDLNHAIQLVSQSPVFRHHFTVSKETKPEKSEDRFFNTFQTGSFLARCGFLA
jgi:hypothetical protein